MTIKEIRNITGLSQAKFSELYKIPKRTLENWESQSDKRQPPEYLLNLLERIVKIDFDNKE